MIEVNAKLNVFFDNKLVGKICLDTDNKINFDYSEDWLQAKESFPISNQLPFERVTYVDAAQTYFSNLLPEGKIRKILAAKFRISEDNDYQLLSQLSQDCAGALSINSSIKKPLLKNIKISLTEIQKKFINQPIIQQACSNSLFKIF